MTTEFLCWLAIASALRRFFAAEMPPKMICGSVGNVWVPKLRRSCSINLELRVCFIRSGPRCSVTLKLRYVFGGLLP